MSRVVHFEIHAGDVARARAFYESVFGWGFEDWSEYAGMPYLGVTTGPDDQPGVNGAIMQRHGESAARGGAVNGAVITIGVESFDATAEAIAAAGGTVALPKYALPGMAWQGYYLDTEGNTIGIHQADPDAA